MVFVEWLDLVLFVLDSMFQCKVLYVLNGQSDLTFEFKIQDYFIISSEKLKRG